MILGWVWLVLIFATVIVEAFFYKKIAGTTVPASVVGIVLDVLQVYWLIELAAVLAIFVFCVVLVLVINKRTKKSSSLCGIESIVGEKCVVVERIDNFAGCGEVRVNGQIWSARGVGEEDVFEEGEVLNIVALEGVKVVCRK